MGMHIDRMNGIIRAYSMPIVRIVSQGHAVLAWAVINLSTRSLGLSITGKENLFFNPSRKAKASMKRKA